MIRPGVAEFIRFGLVGGFVTVVHMLLVFVLTDLIGVWYLYASVISYIIAMMLNFIMQKLYVRKSVGTHAIPTQFAQYVMLAVFCLILNTLGMYGLVNIMFVQYLYAQALVLGLLALFTFFMYRTLIFH